MAAVEDFELTWDLPDYPQLPKMFTNAKAAKKRKHREFIMTEADLEHVVKIPKGKRSAQEQPKQAAPPSDTPPQAQATTTTQQQQQQQQQQVTGTKRHKTATKEHPAAPSNTKVRKAQPTSAGGTAVADGNTAGIKLSKADQKKLRREAHLLASEQHQGTTAAAPHPHTKPSSGAAATEAAVEAGAAADAAPGKKKRKAGHSAQQQAERAAVVAPDAVDQPQAAPAAVLPRKSKKNKFKTPEFLQQQQQQQQQVCDVAHKQQSREQRDSQDSKQQQAPTLEQQHKKQKKQKPSKHTATQEQQQQQQQQQQNGSVGGPAAAAAPAARAAKGGAQQQNGSVGGPAAAAAPAARAAKGGAAPHSLTAAAGAAGGVGGGSKLLQQFKERLKGSRFRQLNEALYTQPGNASFSTMQQQPELFSQYHQGFQQQVKAWPAQPLDAAIQWLRGQPKDWVVADFGCGEARLAASVTQEVHSLDLVAAVPGVIACNMAHTPLDTGSCDVAVFSLALMGTDYGSFLLEAARVLKAGGWLWVAEVRSRFADGGSGKEDFRPLLGCLKELGFKLAQQDARNKMFVVWVLQKKAAVKQSAAARIKWPPLRACVYKKR